MNRLALSPIGLLLLCVGLGLSACGQGGHMANQPRQEALEASGFFEDGASARLPVEHTVARGERLQVRPPEQWTLELLTFGQERFNIYCSVCHGHDGYGTGMVVQRGFPQPPSYHTERLRTMSDQRIFEVMTNGLGKMPPYGKQVSIEERWAIIGYIRALQRSQNAGLEDVPPPQRDSLLSSAETEEANP
jgi:cytochrome c5